MNHIKMQLNMTIFWDNIKQKNTIIKTTKLFVANRDIMDNFNEGNIYCKKQMHTDAKMRTK